MNKARKARSMKRWTSADRHGRIDTANLQELAGAVYFNKDDGERRIRVLVTEVPAKGAKR